MNTWSNRANSLFCYAAFTLFVLLVLNACTRPFLLKPPIINTIELDRVEYLRKNNAHQCDEARITLNIDADFRPLFNWNTHMLFVYVLAEYQTKHNVVSQVALWDRIIQSKSEAHVVVKGQRGEYPLSDQHYGLRGTNVNLTLSWDFIPIAGLLKTQKSEKTSSFTLADDYFFN